MNSGTVVAFYEPGHSQNHDGFAPRGWLLGERWATGTRQERWYEFLDLAQADLRRLGMEVSEDGMRAEIPDAPGSPGSDASIARWHGGAVLLTESGPVSVAERVNAALRRLAELGVRARRCNAHSGGGRADDYCRGELAPCELDEDFFARVATGDPSEASVVARRALHAITMDRGGVDAV